MKKATILAIIALQVITLAGCKPYYEPELPRPNYYYINEDFQMRALGRVAFVELQNHSRYADVSNSLTRALYQQIQRNQLFGMTLIRATDARWENLKLDFEAAYSLEELAMIRNHLQTDAIMLGTVTEYQPYPHLQVGLRLWLLDLNENQLLWAVEHVWDASDKNTRHRIERYYNEHLGQGYAPLQERIIAVSPLKFFDFVANEVASTLNP